MSQGILASKSVHTQGKVLYHSARSLPVHQVTIHKGVFKKWGNSIDIILAHLSDVLEKERQRFQNSVLDIELGQTILIQQRREDSERSASLSNDSNCNRCTHTILPFLYLQIVEKNSQHVLRANGFGDVAKSVDSSTTNGLLVRLEHIQEFETDTHPFLGRDKLRSPVCNTTNQIYTILLNFLMSVPQDWRQTWKQILDGGSHLRHTNNIDNALETSQNRAQHLGVFLTEILIQNNAQMVEQLLFSATLHDSCNATNQVCCLLAHFRRFVVQTPLQCTADLWQVRLDSFTEGIDNRSNTIKHNLSVFRLLLLEGIQDTINHLLFKALINIRRSKVCDNFLYALHDHLAVWF
mmetsp:Transcript_16350/g.54741  ORF Transcript_16350/g.54741 Transcript_16350/m.54741 type:complete len:351 (+) Transcript_16350:350-1402(+)